MFTILMGLITTVGFWAILETILKGKMGVVSKIWLICGLAYTMLMSACFISEQYYSMWLEIEVWKTIMMYIVFLILFCLFIMVNIYNSHKRIDNVTKEILKHFK